MAEEILLTGERLKVESNNFTTVGSVPTVFYFSEFVTAAEEETLLNNVYQAPISKWKSLKNRRLQNWGGVVHEKGLLSQDCVDTPPSCLEIPPWLKHITSRIYSESGLFPAAINHVLINEYLPDQGIMPHQDGPAYVPVVAILSLGSPVVMDFSPHPIFKNAECGKSECNCEDIISKPADMDMRVCESLSEHRPFSVVLMPRSLLIFKDKAYSDYLHGIKDCEKQSYDEVVNIANGLNVRFPSDLKIENDDTEAGGDSFIYRTTTRVSLTCRIVKRVHKNLIKL